MAETLDTQSLVSMASAAGNAPREAHESRFKSTPSGTSPKNTSADKNQRGGFDGFLNSFLGKDKGKKSTSPATPDAKRTTGNSKTKQTGKAESSDCDKQPRRRGPSPREDGFEAMPDPLAVAQSLPPEDRQALRDSLEKTIPADVAEAEVAADGGEFPPEVSAAAEEAAQLIWNLLYGEPAEGYGEPAEGMADLAGIMPDVMGQGADALKVIARHFAAQVPEGVPAAAGTVVTVDLAAMADAIDTANTSAQMNNAAVLSALDDLLDGMPRAALEEALVRTADALGLPHTEEGDAFSRIAAALGVEEATLTSTTAKDANLLSFLQGAAVHSEVATTEVDVTTAGTPAPAEADAAAQPQAETPLAESESLPSAAESLPASAATVSTETETEAPVPVADTENAAPAAAPDSQAVPAATESDSAVERDVDAESLRRNPLEAEKTAGTSRTTAETDEAETLTPSEILKEFEKYCAETAADRPAAPALTADMPVRDAVITEVRQFAAWLQDNSNSKEMKRLTENPEALLRKLMEGVTTSMAEQGQKADKNPSAAATLEMVLQFTAARRESAALLATLQEDKAALAGSFTTAGQTDFSASAANGLLGPEAKVSQTPASAQSGTANPTSMSSMLDQMENIERLSEAMKMSARNGIKELTMQLSPAELGKVMLRVEAVDGKINAYLRVEKPEAAAQLGAVLDNLREALRNQGVDVGELSLRQQGMHEALGDFSGQRQNGREAHGTRGRGNGRRGRAGNSEGGTDEVEAVAISRSSGPGALNVIV